MPDERTRSAVDSTDDDENLDQRGLIRLAGWGAAAVCALLFAVLATRSDIGTQRVAMALGQAAPAKQAQPSQMVARSAELEFETRQLSATVRSLSADRDRLLARVTVLERSIEDVTGSISRAAVAAKPAQVQQAGPAPKIDPAETQSAASAASAAPAASATSSASSSALNAKPEPAPLVRLTSIGPSVVATISSPIILPTPSPETLARVGLSSIPSAEDEDGNVTRTEFGVDVGSGATLNSLRNAWGALRRNHGQLFEGLYPTIAIRDNANRQSGIELRLVIGPLVNAAAAARLCGTLANAGMSCQPVIFNGQRLALR